MPHATSRREAAYLLPSFFHWTSQFHKISADSLEFGKKSDKMDEIEKVKKMDRLLRIVSLWQL